MTQAAGTFKTDLVEARSPQVGDPVLVLEFEPLLGRIDSRFTTGAPDHEDRVLIEVKPGSKTSALVENLHWDETQGGRWVFVPMALALFDES